MKRLSMILLPAILLVTACKKEHPAKPAFKPDNFLFGKYRTKCLCNMVGVTFYLANNDHLYRELLLSNLFSKTNPMPDSEYALVKPFVDYFPSYLLAHPGTTIGCTSCDNSDHLTIMTVNGADTLKWNISLDTASMPADIKPYMQQLNQVWETLK